jgi:hypothetical protein
MPCQCCGAVRLFALRQPGTLVAAWQVVSWCAAVQGDRQQRPRVQRGAADLQPIQEAEEGQRRGRRRRRRGDADVDMQDAEGDVSARIPFLPVDDAWLEPLDAKCAVAQLFLQSPDSLQAPEWWCMQLDSLVVED